VATTAWCSGFGIDCSYGIRKTDNDSLAMRKHHTTIASARIAQFDNRVPHLRLTIDQHQPIDHEPFYSAPDIAQ
jgi:hypothetical protein